MNILRRLMSLRKYILRLLYRDGPRRNVNLNRIQIMNICDADG